MSFQAYLDTIKKKTGKGPDDFRELAEKRGLLRDDVKASEVVAWLKINFSLGHGHAMAIYGTLRSTTEPKRTTKERVDAHFTGQRSQWSAAFERISALTMRFGEDATTKVGDSYISFLRDGRKFAIVKVGVAHLDLGIKLKGVRSGPRLQDAGDWNRMVTHRVRLTSVAEIDRELAGWLRMAYNGL